MNKIDYRLGRTTYEMLTLKLLTLGDSTIAKVTSDLHSRNIIVSESTIFGVLYLLENRGSVERNDNKIYRINEFGREHLNTLLLNWCDINRSVSNVITLEGI